MGRLTQNQGDWRLALDCDLLLAGRHVHPLAAIPDLIGVVRVDLLDDQVEVVILEHGDAPAEVVVHAQRRKRHQGLIVAVEFEAGRRELRFVPH
ncbi:hypothetical protein D9M72_649160 [compost metagenome]